MTCESYNLVKDGDLRSRAQRGIYQLDAVAINALYDGSVGTLAATVSGSPAVSALLAEFGEAYDVCHVDYYTDEVSISNIQINYGTTSGTPYTASVSEISPGVYRGTIADFASFIEIRHTVSGVDTELYQVDVSGVRNESMGFGNSSGTGIDRTYLPHATANTLSASATPVTIYNDNHFADTARVAVVPTFTVSDDYVFLSTSSSGTYYGISDYGYRQPGSKPVILQNDSFMAAALSSQWELRTGGQQHIVTPTADGLAFDLGFNKYLPGSVSADTTGVISKEFFTATSFTVEVEVRFTGLEFPYEKINRDFSMVVTSSLPLPSVGYFGTFLDDNRRGISVGGLTLRPGAAPAITKDNLLPKFRFVDGVADLDPGAAYGDSTEEFWPGSAGDLTADHIGQVDGPTLAEFEDIMYEGNDLFDLTGAAPWHTWRLVYDHRRQELTGYVDNIYIGSRVFRSEPFREGCKLFMGYIGAGGFAWTVRNFRMWEDDLQYIKNVALVRNGVVPTATISGVAANTELACDGVSSTAYVGPEPNSISHFRVDFEQPYDIAYYRLRQPSASTGTEAFGETYYPDIATAALVDFGGVASYVHSYSSAETLHTRSPTLSGTATTLSGVSYVDWQFLTYDTTAQTDNALVIQDIEVYGRLSRSALPPEEASYLQIPWVDGRWHNLRQTGTGNSLALKDLEYTHVEAGTRPTPEYFIEGLDYGFSSAVAGSEFADTAGDYHRAVSLFSGFSGGDTYAQWHSRAQTDNHIFIWRQFAESSRVKGVYWDCTTLRPSNKADKFKIQYLLQGRDPNDEGSWVDVPPVTVQHPYSDTGADTNYLAYKGYLIANNDGEYYTGYSQVPTSTYQDGFSVGFAGSLLPVPQGLIVPSAFTSRHVVLAGSVSAFRANGLQGYVEFDEAVTTRAIRFVVHTVVTYDNLPANNIALKRLDFFRENSTGSYLSPVFDTGTPLNTERLKAVTRAPEGSSATVFVRSFSLPPVAAYDTQYETWRSIGMSGVEGGYFPAVPSYLDQAVARANDDNMYFILKSVPLVYNTVTDAWSVMGGGYPAAGDYSSATAFEAEGTSTSVTSPGLLPEDRVMGHSAFLSDGDLYVSAYAAGDVRTPRIMKYAFSGSFLGWQEMGDNRATFSEYAVMVGYGQRLYFFERTGIISYYDVDTRTWTVVDAVMPIDGGTRQDVATAVWGDNVYIFGGRPAGTRRTDVFNFTTLTMSYATDAPYDMKGHQAIPVTSEGVIYVIPRSTSYASNYAAFMKYYPIEDRWDMVEPLMWWRDVDSLASRAAFYCYREGYIYAYRADQAMRTRVSTESWAHGKVPATKDTVWGGSSSLENIAWEEIGTLGELLPQSRYFQFKVELSADDREHTPVLESINIVTAQSVPVPASGTADFYVKVGVSSDETYQSWYTGAGTGSITPDYSIIYAESEDGVVWGGATTASGSWNPLPWQVVAVKSPWVLRLSAVSYKYWFARNPGYSSLPDDIYYSASSSPLELSGEVLAVPATSHAQSAKGVSQPCVVQTGVADYHMWYTGTDSGSTTRIFHATSSGGAVWANHQPVIAEGTDLVNFYDQEQVRRPSVIEDNGLLKMWYTGRGSDGLDRILYTTSSGGISWETPELAFTLGFEETGLDTLGASRSMVLKDEETYIMYYFSAGDTGEYVIRAVSPDGVEWFSPEVAIPPYGIEAVNDIRGVVDFFALVNRDVVVPGEFLTGAKLKLHNEGAAI